VEKGVRDEGIIEGLAALLVIFPILMRAFMKEEIHLFRKNLGTF
jgi:hypothetical protein